MAYETGRRAVGLVVENITPSTIMTRAAFANAIVVASAIAASTNCPIHVDAIARHIGLDLTNCDWQRVGDVPVLANVQPAGEYLGEDFYRAGGVPAILGILKTGDRIRVDLRKRRADVLISDEEIEERRRDLPPLVLDNQTPWQEIYRSTVGQLDSGGCMELALKYQDLVRTKGIPRDSH